MSRFLRTIKDGFLGAFRHGALLFSSVSSVTITLVLMAIFMLLNANIVRFTEIIEQSVSLHVQIQNEVDEAGIEELENKITQFVGVTTVEFSDKDNELELLIASGGEQAEELYGQYRGEANPLLNAFVINVSSGAHIQEIASQIRELEGIHQVSYGGEATEQFLVILETIRNVGFIFVLVLGGIAIFLISNTISATVISRQKEISIMRTVGASNWFIRWPFIIEGMIIGFIGSLLPIGLTVFGYSAIYDSQSTGVSSFFQLVTPEPVIWEVSLVILLVGMVVGAIGSLFTVSRRLRWTR
ncbi:cell division protein FtsX [Erysipelothrix larvae]|uniref:Cell division protein FtsX n=1 Tax=Erysipelothrix larvae TaxID=1514105 RepID=A0A0X8GY09_9FIRM|nr:permease-like cell division protein FtsX [Erysipelothrix larvae]AMC92510.1 cell division protein FtsX [Erysipelothrix larvae]